MPSRFFAALAVLCWASAVGAWDTPAGQEPVVDELAGIEIHDRVDVDLQQLYVTVTDGSGERVLDLEAADFRLRDDSRPQEIVTFSRGDVPFTALLLLDASGSMAGPRLEVALSGLRAFVEGMSEHDEAKVLAYSDRLRLATGFFSDPATVDAAWAETEAGNGTALLDHLYLSFLLLEKRLGRRVVILLSDGWDLHSVLEARDVERLARLSQATVYWVRLAAAPQGAATRVPVSAWRDQRSSREIRSTLERVVKRSGGRAVAVPDVAGVGAALRTILRELREQYALGYSPDPRRDDGSWRPVEITVNRRGLKVRTRDGYVDR